MNEKPQGAGIARIAEAAVFWGCLIVPAILSGLIVGANAVDVPMWDDWERGPLLRKWHEGTLGFSDLYAAHIQHRMVLPRILLIALNSMSGGDLRWEIAATFGIVCITGLLLALLIRRTIADRWDAVVAVFLVSAILFCPVQYQNFLWPIQTAFVMPALFLAAALLAWTSRLGPWWRWGLMAMCAVLGTHTFAHGMMLWPTLLPLLLLSPSAGTLRSRVWLAGAWIALTAVVMGMYFHELKNTSHPIHAYRNDTEGAASFRGILENPGNVPIFLMRMLGSLLGRTPGLDVREASHWIGGGVLVLYALACLLFLLRYKDGALREKALPWMVAGGFGLLCAAAVTLGRCGVSPLSRALTTRYIGMTQFLLIGLCVLLPLLSRGRRFPNGMPAPVWSLAGALSLSLALTWVEGKHLSESWASARRAARAQLALVHVARPSYLTLIDGNEEFLLKQVRFIGERGWFTPPLLTEPWLEAFAISRSGTSKSKAAIFPAQHRPDGSVVVSGFAYVPGTQRPADAVILCSREGERWRMRSVADPDLPPAGRETFALDYEFTSWHKPGHENLPGWTRTFPAPPDTGEEWSAWILDSEKWKAYRIPGDPFSSGGTKE